MDHDPPPHNGPHPAAPEAPPIRLSHVHTVDVKKLEAEFHKRLAPLVNRRTQGYVMGAFRDAVMVTTGVPNLGP